MSNQLVKLESSVARIFAAQEQTPGVSRAVIAKVVEVVRLDFEVAVSKYGQERVGDWQAECLEEFNIQQILSHHLIANDLNTSLRGLFKELLKNFQRLSSEPLKLNVISDDEVEFDPNDITTGLYPTAFFELSAQGGLDKKNPLSDVSISPITKPIVIKDSPYPFAIIPLEISANIHPRFQFGGSVRKITGRFVFKATITDKKSAGTDIDELTVISIPVEHPSKTT